MIFAPTVVISAYMTMSVRLPVTSTSFTAFCSCYLIYTTVFCSILRVFIITFALKQIN